MSTETPATETPPAAETPAPATKSKVELAKEKALAAKDTLGTFLRTVPSKARTTLKLAPQEDETKEGFLPSPFALWAVVDKKTDYEAVQYEPKYTGDKKVLVVCTEERYMTMANETKFHTGNHPVETLVPMMHLAQAGFGMDICTPTGKDVKLEMWAMPQEDEAVKAFYETKKADFEKPLSLSDLMASSPDKLNNYIAVFVPGGHGAMLGLPENKDMTKLLAWVKENDKTMLSICHGPAALLAGVEEGKDFLYKDYEMVAFPDRVDKITPLLGYIPGQMPWYFGEKLIAAGVKIINSAPNGYVHKDRKLISGDSPKAANAFGKLAAESLLEEVKE